MAQYTNSDIDKCVKSKHCKKEFEKSRKIAIRFFDGMISQLKKKSNKNSESKKSDKIKLQSYMNTRKKLTLRTKKDMKQASDYCKKTYCNIGCKGTLFESGTEIPKELLNKFKSNKMAEALKPIFSSTRKKLFGNKTNILNDNFYEKLRPSVVQQMKKDGALSGCVTNKSYLYST